MWKDPRKMSDSELAEAYVNRNSKESNLYDNQKRGLEEEFNKRTRPPFKETRAILSCKEKAEKNSKYY